MKQKADDMKAALKIQQLHGGPTGNINKWSDQELMQAQKAGLFAGEASGMLGGVTGYEKEVNLLKKAVDSKIGKMKTQGLNYNQFKTALKNLPEFESLARLHDYEGSMEDIFNPAGTAAPGYYPGTKGGTIGDWIIANTTQPGPGDTGLGAVGYDPTGRYNWAEDIEGRRNPETGEWEQTTLGKVHDKFLSGNLTPNEIRKYAHFLDYGTTADQNQNQGGYNYGNRYGGGQRDRNLALLQFLQGGSPIKQLEKSPFMAGMKAAYQDAPETLSEGLFSKIIPGGAFNPKAMKRLVKSWGSGYTNPRYANVAARGGIMSAWNNMRR
jgi:hypothetical protein